MALLRTGLSASNTIIFLWGTRTTRSTVANPHRCSARSIESARTSTWSLFRLNYRFGGPIVAKILIIAQSTRKGPASRRPFLLSGQLPALDFRHRCCFLVTAFATRTHYICPELVMNIEFGAAYAGGWLRALGKTMKTTLLAAASLIAVGTALAHAADLPARAYSKAPAMVAAIHDWSGFYVGLNAGGGSTHNCWTNTSSLGAATVPNASEGCHDATGGLVGGQIGYRRAIGSLDLWSRGPGRLVQSERLEREHLRPGATNQTRVNALGLFTGQVGYTWNNVLWYLKGGRGGRGRQIYRESRPRPALPSIRPAKPVGVAWSGPESNSALRRTGRSASNTAICSWPTAASRSPRQPRRWRSLARRHHSSGRGHRDRSRELPLGRSCHRQALILVCIP